MTKKHHVLLNFRQYQQQVFWNSYSQSECNKENNTLNNRSTTTNSTTNNPPNNLNPPTTLLETLFSYYQRFSSFISSHFLAQHSLFRNKYDLSFWKYYLQETHVMSLHLLTLNILFFVVVFFGYFLPIFQSIISNNKYNNNKNNKIHTSDFIPSFVYMIYWLIQTMLCESFFLFYRYSSHSFAWINKQPSKQTYQYPLLRWFIQYLQVLHLDCLQIWEQICQCLLCLRLFLMVHSLTYLLVEDHHHNNLCYESYLLSENNPTIQYQVMVTMIDIYQSFIFAMLPIPTIIIFYFSMIHTLEITLRIVTCQYLLPTFYHMHYIMILTIISLFISFVLFNVIYSYSLETLIYATYLKLQRETLLNQENHSMVEMLTRETKIPMQNLSRILIQLQDYSSHQQTNPRSHRGDDEDVVKISKQFSKQSKKIFKEYSHQNNNINSEKYPNNQKKIDDDINEEIEILPSHTISKIYHTKESIYLIIDMTVFILTIIEHRFTLICYEEIDLLNKFIVIIHLLQNSLFSHLQTFDLFSMIQIHFIKPKYLNSNRFKNLFIQEDEEEKEEIDNLFILSDKLCIQSLLYYSLFGCIALLGEENLGIDQNNILSDTLFDIIVQPINSSGHNNKKHSFDYLQFIISWDKIIETNSYFDILQSKNTSLSHEKKNQWLLDEMMQSDRYNTLTSAMTIANKIVDTYDGIWEISYNKLIFTCPYKPTSWDQIDENRNDQGIINQLSHRIQQTIHLIPSQSPGNMKNKTYSNKQTKKNRLYHSSISLPSEIIPTFNHFEFNHFLSTQVCFYLTDPQLEDFIVDFRQQLIVHEKITINLSHSINTVDLKIFSIILVQTLDACKLIRNKGYLGEIVLCSEQLIYLNGNNPLEKKISSLSSSTTLSQDKHRHQPKDSTSSSSSSSNNISSNDDINLYSYGISLPCQDRERKRFIKWIQQKYLDVFNQNTLLNDHFSSHSPPKPLREISRKPLSARDLFATHLQHNIDSIPWPFVNQLLQKLYSMFSILDFITSIPFPRDIDMNTYAKWRCLNPSKQYSHHSMPFYLFLGIMLVFDIIETSLHLFRIPYLISCTVPLIVLWIHRFPYFTSMIDRYLGYYNAWQLACLLMVILTFGTCLTEFIRIHPFQPHLHSHEHKSYVDVMKPITHCDFNIFLREKFVTYPGMFTLVSMINLSINMKSTLFLISWPMSIPVIVILCIRSLITIHYIFSQCFGQAISIWMSMLIIFFTLIILRVLHHMERLYRQVFITQTSQIYSKDYVLKLIDISNKSLFLPLQTIQTIQQTCIQHIFQLIIQEKAELYLSLLHEITLLNRNIVLTRALIFRMNVNYYLKHGQLPQEYQSMMNYTQQQYLHLIANDYSMLDVSNGHHSSLKQMNLISQMKAYFLKDLIVSIANHFDMTVTSHLAFPFEETNNNNNNEESSSNSYSFTLSSSHQPTQQQIHLFCYLDSSLSFIRIDKQILQTVLSCNLQKSIQRIQKTYQTQQKEMIMHEILIFLQPYDFDNNSYNISDPYRQQSSIKHNDPHLLDVFIVDTGCISEYQQPTSNNVHRPVYFFHKDSHGFKHLKTKHNLHGHSLHSLYPIEESLHNPFSFVNKYNQCFGFELTYHQGMLYESYYHSFQRFGFPYLLCSDSLRIHQLVNEENSCSIHSLDSKVPLYYSQYCEGLTKAQVDRMNPSPMNSLDSSLFLDPTNHQKTSLLLKTTGLIGIFHYSDSPLIAMTRQLSQLFRTYDWNIRPYSIGSQISVDSFIDKDILILEYDPIHKKNIYPLRDLVHRIHALNYTGLIVVLQHIPNLNNYTSKQALQLPLKNDYTDGITPDLILPFPLTPPAIQTIFQVYEHKLISNMMLTSFK